MFFCNVRSDVFGAAIPHRPLRPSSRLYPPLDLQQDRRCQGLGSVLRHFAPLPLPHPSGRQRHRLGLLLYLRRRLFVFFSFRLAISSSSNKSRNPSRTSSSLFSVESSSPFNSLPNFLTLRGPFHLLPPAPLCCSPQRLQRNLLPSNRASQRQIGYRGRGFVFSRGFGVFLFYGFFVCLFPKKISGFMGLLEIGLVAVFMGLFLGFIFCFTGFDGDLVWLLDLDLGFARDWFGRFLDLGRT